MCDECLILLGVFLSLTDRTREDLKTMKRGINNISETLQTLRVSPTKEEGQFPQTAAIKVSLSNGCLKPVLLIDQWLCLGLVLLGPTRTASYPKKGPKVLQLIHLTSIILSVSRMRDEIKRPKLFTLLR